MELCLYILLSVKAKGGLLSVNPKNSFKHYFKLLVYRTLQIEIIYFSWLKNVFYVLSDVDLIIKLTKAFGLDFKNFCNSQT